MPARLARRLRELGGNPRALSRHMPWGREPARSVSASAKESQDLERTYGPPLADHRRAGGAGNGCAGSATLHQGGSDNGANGWTLGAIAAHDDHSHPNHLGLFIGETRQLKDDKLVGFTVGLDYERKLNKRFGIVGLADFAFGDHKRTALFNAAFAWHPGGGWRLAAGPGFERVDKEKANGGIEKKTYFVFAAGIEYGIHVGEWSISPTVWFDFIGETKLNVAYGVAFGRGF